MSLSLQAASAATRNCIKCKTPTDRLGIDPVTGECGIPLCKGCASSDVGRVLLLVATICIGVMWIV